ncbi:MAG: DUF3179 domain-containing protein [Chloroflexota bacterium]
MTLKKVGYLLILLPLLLTFCTSPAPPAADTGPSTTAEEEAMEEETIEEEEAMEEETNSEMEEDMAEEDAAEAELVEDEVVEEEEAPTEEPEELAEVEVEAEPTEADPSPTLPADETEEEVAFDNSIDEEEAAILMQNLIRADLNEAERSLNRIIDARDQRFASVLIEALWASYVGISPIQPETIAWGLERLTGESFGINLDGWIIWYGSTDLEPPPGFATWKGSLLSIIDVQFADFVNDSQPSAMRVEEIRWGGVRVDGIPPLDQSPMISVEEATYLDDGDAVFGLSINGDNRAYPLRIIDWHEMANDVVGGVPVSIAYCTLCGAAIAYDGRAQNGETYDFSSSGFLFRSNKLMYDRQTRTLWNQMTGRPVLGELVEDEDAKLDILPIVLTSWGEWKELHPDTQVLDVETGFSRIYDTGAAYAHYFSSAGTMFPVWQQSDDLALKDQVYAITFDEDRKAYPIDLLIEEVVVNDTFADQELVLIAPDEKILVEGENRRTSQTVTYSTGAAVRAYERNGHTFELGEDSNQLIDEDGNVWEITEDALIGPDGSELPRLPGHLAYWLGWFGFFPDTELYEG